MIIRSEDGGETWSEPYELCPYKGRVYDAVRFGDAILILHFCNEGVDRVEGIEGFAGSAPEHVYRLYRSDDNGKTFYEQCVVPFPDTYGRAYGNLIVRPDGTLVAYAYNVNDQYNMDYVISPDGGKTWTQSGVSYVAKRIRNPQVGLLDGQYILHGRAGENEAGSGAFVFYTSADGITWDEGRILVDGRPACFYSNNLTVRTPDGKERMLVQYSENYNDPKPGVWSAQVNIMHLWVESV